MKTIKTILMYRDGMPPEEAEDLIREAKEELYQFLEQGDFYSAENICADWFGLEPDYLEELL